MQTHKIDSRNRILAENRNIATELPIGSLEDIEPNFESPMPEEKRDEGEEGDYIPALNSASTILDYGNAREPFSVINRKLSRYERKILEYIRTRKDISNLLRRLQFSLDYDRLKMFAEEAVKYNNIAALAALAEINPIVIAQVVEEHISRFNKVDDVRIIGLYFLIRNELSREKERIFRKLVSHVILRKTLTLVGRRPVRSGTIRKRINYRPALDFDLEGTMEKSLDKILLGSVSRRDIVGIEKRDKRTAGVVIIDFSGSMFGTKNLLASLVSALVSYSLSKNDNFSIIIFNEDAYLIKGINERKNIDSILDIIFNTKPLGFTNIAKALRLSAQELRKSRLKTRKWAILITDGEYNRGDDPLKYAKMFQKLHVIQLGGGVLGTYVCKHLAKGRGRYIRVNNIDELLKAVRRVLKYPDK